LFVSVVQIELKQMRAQAKAEAAKIQERISAASGQVLCHNRHDITLWHSSTINPSPLSFSSPKDKKSM
jgi:hypothetical protein